MKPTNSVQRVSLTLQDTEILKGIAVLLLLCHHLFYEGTDFDDMYLGQIPLVHTFGMQSKLCVAIFVFLSGYGLTSGATKTDGIPNLLAFYRKRYVKLMVNFWLIWLLFVPVGVLVFNRTFPDVYGEHYMIRIFIDLLGICSTSSYNPTWWFYGCIICLYLLFPILYRTIDYWYLLIPLSAVLAFVYIIPLPVFEMCRSYLCAFLMGMAIRKFTPPHTQGTGNSSVVHSPRLVCMQDVDSIYVQSIMGCSCCRSRSLRLCPATHTSMAGKSVVVYGETQL